MSILWAGDLGYRKSWDLQYHQPFMAGKCDKIQPDSGTAIC